MTPQQQPHLISISSLFVPSLTFPHSHITMEEAPLPSQVRIKNEILRHRLEAARYEDEIELLKGEIAYRESNGGDVDVVKYDLARWEGGLRTLRILIGAKQTEMEEGKVAAAKYLGEKIGKGR